MTFLLDVNVLVALLDPAHVAQHDAHAWFAGTGRVEWATGPITENGAWPGEPDRGHVRGQALLLRDSVRRGGLWFQAYLPSELAL